MIKTKMRKAHDGDCTIYASLHNNTPESGICTCGYGWQLVRKGDWGQMYSEELQEKLKQEYEKLPAAERVEIEGLLEKLSGEK